MPLTKSSWNRICDIRDELPRMASELRLYAYELAGNHKQYNYLLDAAARLEQTSHTILNATRIDDA
jgi:hypothetical protein